jgi:hypothetical protein
MAASDVLEIMSIARTHAPQFARHPNVLQMLAHGELLTPVVYVFSGDKWLNTIRRKQLTPISTQIFESSEAGQSHIIKLTLYELFGTSIRIESLQEVSDVHQLIVCRVFAAASLDMQPPPTSLRQWWSCVSAPLASLPCSGGRTIKSDVAPRDEDSMGLSSEASSHSNSSAFSGDNSAAVLVDMRQRGEEYTVELAAALQRLDNFDEARHESLVNVLDELIVYLRGSQSAFHLACCHLDRFLASGAEFETSRINLQLLVCGCALVACKNADIASPSLAVVASVIFQWSGYRPTTAELTVWELRVMSTLRYRLHTPSVLDGVLLLLCVEDVASTANLHTLCRLLCDCCTRVVEFCDAALIPKATALVLYASQVINYPLDVAHLVAFTGQDPAELGTLLALVHTTHAKAASTGFSNAAKQRYGAAEKPWLQPPQSS